MCENVVNLLYYNWGNNHKSTNEEKRMYRKIMGYLEANKEFSECFDIESAIGEYTAEVQRQAFKEGVKVGANAYKDLLEL